jgi:hypothetical protein
MADDRKTKKTDTAPRLLGRHREEATVTLTEYEIQERRIGVMKQIDEIDKIEYEKKETVDRFKSKLSEAETLLRKYKRAATDGKELREVEVDMILTRHNTVEYVRCDTGEVLRSRPASETELQERLFDNTPPQEKAFG